MPTNRVLSLRTAADDSVAARALRDGIAAIQAEQQVTTAFAAEVQQAAESAASSPRLPGLDRTDLPFVTIDPASSMDLDQALHLARSGPGYVLSYAIADVAAYVAAGDPVDLEAHRRGQSLYGADSKIPLHPKVLSEAAASLLPDQVRPALVWTVTLDADGERTDTRVERALVRSRAKLSYDGVQQALDAGTADESLQLLREVGDKRIALEIARGGMTLPMPEQEIVVEGERWSLEFRSQLPVELWNAQMSLLCGFGAAQLMLDGGVGVLRTLPPADPRDVKRLRRTAHALKLDWPRAQSPADFIRALDPSVPAEAAMATASTRLLRGSGYAAFDGAPPEQPEHAALASPYAHVTAPLRRLVDRFAGEICVSLCAGTAVPEWVLGAMPELDEEMRESTRRANAYENAVVDLVETGILRPRVGEEFEAAVIEVEEKDPRRGVITVAEPAVEADLTAATELPLGEEVTVRLAAADLATRKVEFRLA
ncbi:RNB domain-containing ribonuclease [Nocardioides sp.]|uniref:RNB domain-containing ribonuclease n=1 Tax=Nocardioides sp. TaxID=35761 RepID=UPI003529594D